MTCADCESWKQILEASFERGQMGTTAGFCKNPDAFPSRPHENTPKTWFDFPACPHFKRCQDWIDGAFARIAMKMNWTNFGMLEEMARIFREEAEKAGAK